MKRRHFLFLVASTLVITGCNQSINTPSDSGDSKDDLVLHGASNPIDSIGNDYDVYINEQSLDLFQKNGGVWIPNETKGNQSFFIAKKANRLKEASQNDESKSLYEAIINSLLCTNNQVVFEMFYGLPHDYIEQDLETAMHSVIRYSFDSGKMISDYTNSIEDLKKDKINYSKYGYYDISADKHYYSIDNNSWTYINPDDPTSFIYQSISTTCIDKTFEFSGIDNGLTGLFVGEQYTKTSDDKYVFSNIPLKASILAKNYENFQGIVNGEITLSDDRQYVSYMTIELVWEGNLINQGHLEGVSLINCEFSNFKTEDITLNNIENI